MTTSPSVHLHAADAAEPAESLQFLGNWLACGHDQLHRSLAQFVGNPAYGISEPPGDLNRLAFLLGADTGPQLFGDELPAITTPS